MGPLLLRLLLRLLWLRHHLWLHLHLLHLRVVRGLLVHRCRCHRRLCLVVYVGLLRLVGIVDVLRLLLVGIVDVLLLLLVGVVGVRRLVGVMGVWLLVRVVDVSHLEGLFVWEV